MTSLTIKRIGNPAYTPANLLDELIVLLGLKNDAALAKALEISPVIVSKVRSQKLEVSAGILLRMHDVVGLPVDELRSLMGTNQ